MTIPRRKSARIASALAALILSTACSTTNETTITAATVPSDTAPTDTATPIDSTAPTAPTDGPTLDDHSPDTVTPTTEPATSEPSPQPVSTESDQIVLEYPDALLTNLSDRSTPLGRLCWAFWEFGRMSVVEFFNTLAASPAIAIVGSHASDINPDVSDIIENENDPIGPVGITDEETEEPTLETNSYGFLDALSAIQEPQIARVVDDPGLSGELQVFAKAFFEMIEAIEEQAKVVGYRNVDYSQLTYKDIDSLPNIDVFSKAAGENPTQCRWLYSDSDRKDWLDQFYESNNISD